MKWQRVSIIDGKKMCTKCELNLPLSEFHKRPCVGSILKLHSWCKKCSAITSKNRQKTEQCKVINRRRAKIYRNGKGRESCLNRRAALRARDKEACINMYSNGDACCAYCGIADMDVLCLDHIDDNGSQWRREKRHPNGSHLYMWLRQREYPCGFQVLCMNCNFRKMIFTKRDKSKRAKCGREIAQSAALG